MGSMIPFLDLNLIPDPPIITTTISPKIEPKLEPVDEPLQSILPLFPNLSPNSVTESQFTPDPFSPSQGQERSPDENNVYSEFYRVSELFKSAFAKRLQGSDEAEILNPDALAIVPASEENHVSTVVVRPKRYTKRSNELVRVTDLGIEDQRYFRDIVRRTRMLHDSLRLISMVEDEKRRGFGLTRDPGDLRASSLMRDRGLWLNRDKRIVGSIPGVYVGDVFLSRLELCMIGLHGLPQGGIDYLPASQSTNGEPIATSVVVSGGYEDDEDSGEQLIYTGQGGQDKKKQVFHQKLEGGNLALERSMHYGIEVRLIRGIEYQGGIGSKVYVYDGLYKITDSWFDIGKSGFGVYKYKLVRIDGQPEMGSTILRYAKNLRARPLEVRPIGYMSFDISLKKENIPVFLYNDIDNDHEPLYYEYLKTTVFPPLTFNQGGSGYGCDCVSGCTYGCSCAFRNGEEFAYDRNGLLLKGKPLIFECGASCRCPPRCRNRVTQRGIQKRFEIFRSRETGWGVRSLDLIQAGSFICEYSGVFLTRDQAAVFAMNGDNLIYPNRFTDRWTEWGDFSQIYSDYSCPSQPSIPPLDFAIDVSRMRNVSCYISHSSSPNVLVQLVLYDHNNVHFPHLMLFASENIPPLRELSLDYGVADEWAGKPLPLCN